jgi:G3E family GTPase
MVLDRVPVTLLTGFLGSGKSTLLTQILRDPGFADTAIIVNEFGEVGLDGILIHHEDDQIVEMTSGCICCTIRGDIRQTLLKLQRELDLGKIPNFSRLVVESTGLADPAPVIHTLMCDPFLDNHYMLGGVITTIDAINGEATLDSHKECLKQIAVADRLVITKTDLIDESSALGQLEKLKSKLSSINPNAPILYRQEQGYEFSSLFNTSLYDPNNKTINVRQWLNDEANINNDEIHNHQHVHGHDHHDVTRHGSDIRSFTLVFEEPIELDSFAKALEVLAFTNGTNLLRLKGIVNTTDRPGKPLVVHGVQHVFHDPVWLDGWPDENHQSRLVFITNKIDRETLDDFFKSWLGSYKGQWQ